MESLAQAGLARKADRSDYHIGELGEMAVDRHPHNYTDGNAEYPAEETAGGGMGEHAFGHVRAQTRGLNWPLF